MKTEELFLYSIFFCFTNNQDSEKVDLTSKNNGFTEKFIKIGKWHIRMIIIMKHVRRTYNENTFPKNYCYFQISLPKQPM